MFLTSGSTSVNEPAQPSFHSLHDIQFSDSDVLAILTTLDVSKACGIDNKYFDTVPYKSVCNYRPISLLCILSKVLERIVYNNMIDYVRELTTKYQFGF